MSLSPRSVSRVCDCRRGHAVDLPAPTDPYGAGCPLVCTRGDGNSEGTFVHPEERRTRRLHYLAGEFQGLGKRPPRALRRLLAPPGAGLGLSGERGCRTGCGGGTRRALATTALFTVMAKVTSYQSHLHENAKAALRTGRFAPQDTGRTGR